MKLKRVICAIFAAVMLLCAVALADTYVSPKKLKPGEELYTLDRANVLSDATKGEIVYSNDLLYKACGAQIAVVTVGTTGSDAIDDYATELFNAWGIGDAGKGNGFLLLLAIDDEDYYALCGDGLQPKFTAGSLKDYFDRYLEADFAAGRYDAGVKKFFEAVFERVASTYNADVTVEQGIASYLASGQVTAPGGARFGGGVRGANSYAGNDDEGMGFGMIFAVIVVIVLVIVLMRAMNRRARMGSGRNVFVSPPPQQPFAGQGGYRGVNNAPGPGGYRGPVQTRRTVERDDGAFFMGWLMGMLGSGRHSGGYRPSGGSRSRSTGSFFRSSGSSRSHSSRSFGGGRSSGGGAGRGRH